MMHSLYIDCERGLLFIAGVLDSVYACLMYLVYGLFMSNNNLVDPANNHMIVSHIKPCMS